MQTIFLLLTVLFAGLALWICIQEEGETLDSAAALDDTKQRSLAGKR
ncbi:MAG: hypothetical protein AAGF77_07320 [Bacteroidota bacterium]